MAGTRLTDCSPWRNSSWGGESELEASSSGGRQVGSKEQQKETTQHWLQPHAFPLA